MCYAIGWVTNSHLNISTLENLKMKKQTIGILHPGLMGISVAVSAQNSGYMVYWASNGRSTQTRERADKHQLLDAETLDQLCQTCSVIISVCPPHAAEDVADAVLSQNFRGIYADANAISPQRATRIEQAMTTAGVAFVDGGIIGGPAWQPGKTWLYLSGSQAQTVANCFSAGPLETSIISNIAGQASALKMCYAAYTKGSTALLCVVLAAAETLEVREALAQQWVLDGAGLDTQAPKRAQRVTAKAWRFAGEMDEIAATFKETGMPGGFHEAASEIYRRLAGFKDAPEKPSLEEVLGALIQTNEE